MNKIVLFITGVWIVVRVIWKLTVGAICFHFRDWVIGEKERTDKLIKEVKP